MVTNNIQGTRSPARTEQAKLRRFPYPYGAMLAISSDLDETPNKEAYFGLLRFLNTREATPVGEGAGLEVANSLYFDMPEDQFAYWNTDDSGRESLRALIRSGHIDTMHSLGDLATTRGHVEKALSDLESEDCRLKVWVDHAVAPTNFGRDIMKGRGDVRGDPAYHADLAAAHGFRYFWMGRTTSVIGQNRPFSLRYIARWGHPKASLDTLAREAAKHILARRGNPKYRAHKLNRVFYPTTLRDGRKVFEFLRCNPYYGGISSCENAKGVHEVITPQFLESLLRRKGFSILYTHLGKIGHLPEGRFLGEAAAEAFRTLSGFQAEGRVLVAATRRLLDYCHMAENITHSASTEGDRYVIDVRADWTLEPGASLEEELQGLTFYLPEGLRGEIRVNGEARPDAVINPPDGTGRRSLSLPWVPLVYPAELAKGEAG